MAKLLYLVHRLPYPPNKGDKVRSYHLLKHLSERHDVYLGTFVDDPEDEVHLPTVRAMCADLHAANLRPTFAKFRSLASLPSGEPMSLRYYRDSGMRAWVEKIHATRDIDATVVFSSAMAQYAWLTGRPTGAPTLIDFVDVDSAKWTQYRAQHRWPLSWIYGSEGRRLLAYERSVALRAQRSFFVTQKETALFQKLAPECAPLVEAVGNGVDSDFFCPIADRASPFGESQTPIVFTGAMDYWPNVDAARWFVAEVLPTLRMQRPDVAFYIVGRSPTPAVQALASNAVVVTGTVEDVRPYLQHAAVVVAPMRVARGVQNKILEAMAMGRPVVAARECVQAIDAVDGEDLLSAASAAEFVEVIEGVLTSPARAAAVGAAGRQRVVDRFSWAAHLSAIDRHLPMPVDAVRVEAESLVA